MLKGSDLKYIILIVVIIILGVSLLQNKYKENKYLRNTNKNLIFVRDSIASINKNLNKEIEVLKKDILVLEDSVKKQEVKIDTIYIKRDSAITVVDLMPGKDLYDTIRAEIPDSSEASFVFSEKQMKTLYKSYVEDKYNKSIIVEVRDQNIYLKSIIYKSNEIIQRQESIIINQGGIVNSQDDIIKLQKNKIASKNLIIGIGSVAALVLIIFL